MSAQRYESAVAQERMAADTCPECGLPAGQHIDDDRFWMPRLCSLLPRGVDARLAQFRADIAAIPPSKGDGPFEQPGGAW